MVKVSVKNVGSESLFVIMKLWWELVWVSC